MALGPVETPEDKRHRFEATAVPFMGVLYKTALRLTHRPEDASDLLQETYLKAYRGFEGFAPGTNCKAWLFTVLYSVFVNRYRKSQREPPAVSIEELELVLVGLAVLLWPRRRVPDLPALVARDYARVRSGALQIDLRTTDPKALEQLFAANGIPFETRVFDLGMMGYRVVGGRVHLMAGGPSALFAYEGQGLLICQMFRGRLADLPGPELVRESQGIRFHVYRREGLTLVFWEEGEVPCVLVSEIPAQEVIQLAFAKAMKVARRRLDRPAERQRLRVASGDAPLAARRMARLKLVQPPTQGSTCTPKPSARRLTLA